MSSSPQPQVHLNAPAIEYTTKIVPMMKINSVTMGDIPVVQKNMADHLISACNGEPQVMQNRSFVCGTAPQLAHLRTSATICTPHRMQ